ncbi:MAG TPA: hypothetical protein VFZ91_03990 [Allosphingosinicella sp.]
MIYSVEQYYESAFAEYGREDLGRRLTDDKITMAMMLASGSSRKSGVDLVPFLSLVRMAEEQGSLAVYVNVYGRPVSYVIWGYYDRSENTDSPAIWFGDIEVPADLYLVDFAVRENSVDETIALWANHVQGERITVPRSDRPKKLRTYRLPRIREFAWRVSYVEGRFRCPKGHGIFEHESNSRDLIAEHRQAQAILHTIADDINDPLDITKVVPLMTDLLSVDQCQPLFEDGDCRAALVVALSDAARWSGRTASELLELPFRQFVDGEDIVFAGLYGDEAGKRQVYDRQLSNLERAGERLAYISESIWSGLSRLESGAAEGKWRRASSDVPGLIRLVRD